jgi:FAD/FMN-containing dehydrogenase
MVRGAIAEGIALLPVGGGRRADFGNLPSRELTPISTRRLTGVVEHDVDNQTATFAAGTLLADPPDALAGHDQWLPFRPPLADRTTIGGLVALGACGPDRLAHGAPRDRLLGVRFVSGLGKLIRVGGRVVKNVAGYDLSRLLAGSAGTLGLITEATFRVAAIPNICRALVASGTLDRCAEAAAHLLRSNLEPTFVAATPGPDEHDRWTLAVGFEGFEVTIAAQWDGAATILREAGLDEHQDCDYALRDGLYGPALHDIHAVPFVLRADVPVGTVAQFLDSTRGVLASGTLLADFGCGRVTAGLPALANDAWTCLTDAACALGGHLIAEKAPEDFKAAHDVFGPPRSSWSLMHRVKAALDPHDLFAPGRLPPPQG